ncbi:MAG: hypothetical protein G3M70_00980 [Candidatus Nitronauta litoralis]|uniref:Uncharacterized protein n=1 Tax=Candidatus Nitronauta litoralis TaxID=2705533 RepID=A0A7T0BTA0_9BACT|nr:MAG: hypothetical protein G3M70_00980 [Candidatus Nitronauta litoralis]
MKELFDLMREYAAEVHPAPAEELPHPELGKSLGLFHVCLLETDLARDEIPGMPSVNASPDKLEPNHLSRFVVGFLPFNSVSTPEETNQVLFDVYSFINWLDKKNIPHGWAELDFSLKVRELLEAQKRCLELSHYLDEESGRILEDPPAITHTMADVFQVVNIDEKFVTLKGLHHEDTVRIGLPGEIVKWVRPHDHMDLVLGDTSERWVLLEAGQVFPEFESDK